MNLFSRKLRFLSMAVCTVIIAMSVPQPVAGAISSSAKLSGIKEIVTSPGFWGGSSFAIGKDGTVWAWGSNYNGQFANGTAGPEGWTITPQMISALDQTKQLNIGKGYYLALKEDGTVSTWGDFTNKSAAVANSGASGKQHQVEPPQVIPGLTDIVNITTGTGGSLALRKDGTLMLWNPSESSLSGYSELPTAVNVTGLTGVKWIGSSFFNAAVRSNGTLWMWSSDPQLYNTQLAKTPTQISGLTHVKSVSLNDDSLIGLTESGNVWATTRDKSSVKSGITMRRMEKLSGIVSVQTANGINLVKNKKGEYWVWKANTQLQNLQKVTVVSSISKLTLDLDGFAAVKKDGTVWTWKSNELTENKWTFTQPQQIKGLQGSVSFAKGENSKYALLKDGTAVAWGTNMFGQLGISVLESRPFTVSPILKPVTVIVNGKKIESTQSAIYIEGSVRVPIRDVAESLGYTLSWDGDMKLSKEGKVITFKDGQFQLENGKTISLRSGALQVSYTSLVPAGALAQALGASATWDSTLYQLTLKIQ